MVDVEDIDLVEIFEMLFVLLFVRLEEDEEVDESERQGASSHSSSACSESDALEQYGSEGWNRETGILGSHEVPEERLEYIGVGGGMVRGTGFALGSERLLISPGLREEAEDRDFREAWGTVTALSNESLETDAGYTGTLVIWAMEVLSGCAGSRGRH